MGHKITKSKYLPLAGYSRVEIVNHNGCFVGEAWLNDEEDSKMASEYTGCEIAYRRAYLKTLKFKKQQTAAMKKAMEDYYKSISGMRGFNEKSVEAKKARWFIDFYAKEYESVKQQMNDVLHGIDVYIKRHYEFLDKVKENNVEKED